MKRNNEKVPKFDEIVFENRNKEYGAYVIRKKYAKSAILAILGGTSLFVGFFVLLSFTGTPVAMGDGDGIIEIFVVPDSTIIDPNTLKTEPPKEMENKPEVYRYLPPQIVDTVDSNSIQMMANDLLTDTSKYKDNKVEIIPVEDPVIPTDNDDSKVPVIIQEMPVFPGGSEALMKFIYENIKYPEQAVINNIEGRVTLKFVVSADGSVRSATIIKGVDPLLDLEAIRVVSMLPRWKPGKNNGDPAAVWFTVPVKFEIKRN
ncbi:MAG: energy transducer TonB [Bacteroidales bacterium]